MINEAARIVATARRHRDSLTPRAAAGEAWHPGGPSLAELEARLEQMRAWYQERGAA